MTPDIPRDQEPMIAFRDVVVGYDDTVVLPGCSFEVERGAFFSLLGPSGCGKTTALRTLAGLIDPRGGVVAIAGRDVTRIPGAQRDVGMVFQNYALFPSMSVRENIGFGLTVEKRDRAEIRAAVDEIAAQVGLDAALLSRGVSELSGGQQQRVAIARALVMRPSILLLDEPLSNLDAGLRKQLRRQLKQLQRSLGVTTVLVTHDQDEAMSLSDRIAVLRDGRIEQIDTPDAVYERPATPFVCEFIGDTQRLSAEACARLGVEAGRVAYVRPERIRAEAGHAQHGVPGTVVDVAFHGATSTITMDGAVFDTILMEVSTPDARSLRPGDAVTALIDPADLLVFEMAA